MKKRLNFLCLIVVLVLTYSIFEAGYGFFVGARLGVKSVAEKGTSLSAQHELMNMKYISLEPEAFLTGGDIFQDSVYNEKSGTYVPALYSTMAVTIDSHPAKWEMIAQSLLGLLQMIVYIWAIVLFIRLIISINKSDIFNWKNVRRLRRMGLALILSFCCTLFMAYLMVHGVDEVFSLRGYSLNLSGLISTTMLVLGLCSLIVGEVFAIGLKMKEEQDLTI